MNLSGENKYNFTFTKNDLFKKVGNKYFFLIVFQISQININYWRLGQLFFRKYPTFLINDGKTGQFLYYSINKDKEDEGDEGESEEDNVSSATVEDGMEDAEKLTKKEVKSRYTFTDSMKALKKINKETKGYLVVKGTEISYPVVQHSDNNYYLKHDIYKKKTSMGWVFFDYRNKIPEFDDNNIIYGHSMLNGTMFGTLKKTLNKSWRKKEENLIISLTTDKGTFKFKIFSIYKVDYTTDYLKVRFGSKEDKEEFIKMIRGRSGFKNDTPVTADDKILTLSTCAGGNNRRLVVHAVLLKEEENKE